MSELLFEREAELRMAATAYSGARSCQPTDTKEIDAARRRLRNAALAYASIANEIDQATKDQP